VSERIKRTSTTNQAASTTTTIKKDIPTKTFISGTTQGLVKMRRESFAGTAPFNGKK